MADVVEFEKYAKQRIVQARFLQYGRERYLITDVPTADDFAEHGLYFLNLAWDQVFYLMREYAESSNSNCWPECDNNEEGSATLNYWRAASKYLLVAQTLTQQGAEMILKSLIASTSPYLLISNSINNWPRRCEQEDIVFADFRTIDSQDLIKICNATHSPKLPDKFVTEYDAIRKTRNSLLHTVDNRLSGYPFDVVRYILNIVSLLGNNNWLAIRKKYLNEKPLETALNTDSCGFLPYEIFMAKEFLSEQELKDWFNFSKKQRCYICPVCYLDFRDSLIPDALSIAQLRPNTPNSNMLYCLVCDIDYQVDRIKCNNDECKGNVIHHGYCMTCLNKQ